MSKTLFRVHFTDGQHYDTHADKPDDARAAARGKFPGAIITKIKVVKERADA